MQVITNYKEIKAIRANYQYKKDLPFIALSVVLFWTSLLLAIFTN